VNVDVLIIGAGPAGIAAAVGAARSGARSVKIIEKSSIIGGAATLSDVGTICGLYFNQVPTPIYANPGFCEEFGEAIQQSCQTKPITVDKGLWILPFTPVQFEKVCTKFCSKTDIEVFFNTSIISATAESNMINHIQLESDSRKVELSPSAVIDCSGHSAISKALGVTPIENLRPQAAAYVFSVSDIEINTPETLPREISYSLLKGAKEQKLLPACALLSVVPGSVASNSVTLKLPLQIIEAGKFEDAQYLKTKAENSAHQILDYLKCNLTGFSNATISRAASEVGIRSSLRTKGVETLLDSDVKDCRKFPNSIGKGVWPIEEWLGERTPHMHYLPPNDYYDIPAGALKSAEFSNLYFGGKGISATEQAIASARVIGTCLQTGYAAGQMAQNRTSLKSQAAF